MSNWSPILFFEGEDPEALKEAFCRMSATHGDRFSSFEIAAHIFRDLRDPDARAMQAAAAWSKDLGVQERIHALSTYTPVDNDHVPKQRLKSIALNIAEDRLASDRDRLNALRLIAEMQGDITKPIEIKTATADNKPAGGVTFNFVPRQADEQPVTIESANVA